VSSELRADKTAKMTITGGVDGQPDQAFNGIGVLRLDEGGTSMQFAEQVQRPGGGQARCPARRGVPQAPGRCGAVAA
jgi:hypothetical protein